MARRLNPLVYFTLTNELVNQVVKLNAEISDDKSLGKGFCIGHSYFCGRTKENCTDEWMKSVVDYDILPMLAEYWFDNDDNVKRWKDSFEKRIFNDEV